MGYGFIGDGQRNFSMNAWTWPAVARLAYQHGWKPMGTVHGGIEQLGGKPEHWNGSYFSNGGQEVLPEDAMELGRAIHRALEATTARDPQAQGQEGWDEFGSPVDYLGREGLAQFAEFCMATGFYIS